MEEMQLQNEFPDYDAGIIRYVLNEVSGNDLNLAREALKGASKSELDQMLLLLKGEKKLTQEEKAKVEQFMMVANCESDVAEKFLHNNAWAIQDALNSYFLASDEEKKSTKDQEKPEKKKINLEKESILGLFIHLRNLDEDDLESDLIQTKAVQEFHKLIDPDDELSIFVVAYELNATTQVNSISKKEFVYGFQKLQCENLVDIRKKVPQLKESVFSDEQSFREFYNFLFKFKTKRNLSKSIAIELWKLLLSDKNFPLFDEWLKYFKEKGESTINFDIWCCFLEFIRNTQNADEYDWFYGYPSIFDSFIESIS